MKELKGKVVVVHFKAFGCINCARNYPWYKAIWKDFKEKGVVVIGIHTPETEGEKNVKTLQKKLKDAELTFPVAVDNKTTMWKAYSNNYWPSIYLIDKEGIARWGWQSELGWKGANGEKLMREKIEDLIKE
jgi:peroxiredoxin